MQFEIYAVAPTKTVERSNKYSHPLLCFCIALQIGHEYADLAYALRLLSGCSRRPKANAAKYRDELPPPHSRSIRAEGLTLAYRCMRGVVCATANSGGRWQRWVKRCVSVQRQCRPLSVIGPIATFQDLGCVRGLLDEQQTHGVFGKDRTCWQEDRASPMVPPIKSHPKEKPKWHIPCTTRL
jgi:hypothetical protein